MFAKLDSLKRRAAAALRLACLCGAVLAAGAVTSRAAQQQPHPTNQQPPASKEQPPAPKEQPPTTPADELKPPAVLLKPAGVKEDLWATVAASLRKHYRVVILPPAAAKPAPDAKQNGQTKKAPPPRPSETLLNTLRSRKLTNCTLLAMGDDARTAVEAAVAAPEVIKALVLVDLTGPEDVAAEGENDTDSAWKATLSKLTAPTLALYRADLMLGVGSAGQYLKATGLDAAERVRVRRVDSEAPILKTAAAPVAAKITTFLDDVRAGRDIAPETRQKTDSGLSYIDQIVGEGASPKPGQTVAARFRFRTRDGRDVSPPGAMNINWRFPLDHGLTDGVFEALSTMKPGGRRKTFIPSRLLKRSSPSADRPAPDAVLDGQEDTMTVDIFLVAVSDDPPPPPKPKWNASREKTVADGVRTVELTEGTGPAAQDDWLVSFADNLWSASGHLSRYKSVENPDRGVLKDLGDPAVSAVAAKCWPAGIRGMKVGGERLIIAPAKAAFGNTILPSMTPDEDIVFHVKLLEAKPTPAPPHFPVVPEDRLVSVNPKLKVYDVKIGEGPPPAADGAVVLHYAMWRDGGKLLADSTIMRDRPFEQLFKALMPALKQALPDMRVGGVRVLHVQDPFGPGKQGLKPGEWVVYQVELVALMTAGEFEAKSKPAAGSPLQIAPEVGQKILTAP
ncbi:MAG: FKBP-type peptidyl-prolyl cis-trans isomerase [Phycisphaerales bacterium]|nr:FKBP-type peptidyl-prolyl cis-trans isomerase [Phycisphaerales bacterium]